MGLFLLLKILLMIAPMYIANACAMVFGGDIPIDFGLNFLDNKRIFGNGKTWQGTVAGIFFGALAGLILQTSFPSYTLSLTDNYALYGLLVALGAVLGDIIASFFKRRASIERGEALFGVDQLDFVVGALLFGSFLYMPELMEVGIIVILTLLVHKISNVIAFKIKMKRVPW